MSKHTPEPWMVDLEETAGGAPVIVSDTGWGGRLRRICKVLFEGGSEDPEVWANAGRIISCVEACQGMKDPVEEVRALQAVVDKLPDLEMVLTALAANGSMKDGEVVRDEGRCMCDPEVGMCPCQYCAIESVLFKVHEAAEGLAPGAEKEKEK